MSKRGLILLGIAFTAIMVNAIWLDPGPATLPPHTVMTPHGPVTWTFTPGPSRCDHPGQSGMVGGMRWTKCN